MSSMNTYQRAIQVYQVLIAAAYQRQTLTYEMVGERIGMPRQALGQQLHHLQNYCEREGLPPITALVVRKGEGTPSTGYHEGESVDAERERVFAHEWYKRAPLTEAELRDAVSIQ